MKQGTAFLRQRFPTNKLYVSGHSAGAHLTAMLLYVDWAKEFSIKTPSLLSGVCLFSGIFDLTPIKICPAVNTDGCLQITGQDVEELSPWLLAGKGRQQTFCPAIVAVGGLESDESRRQSKEYADHLSTVLHGGVQLHEVPGRDHFDLMESLALPETPMTQIIKNFCWQE